MRGLFGFMAEEAYFKSTPRMWHITPISGNCFWYDLIINPPDFANTDSHIVSYLFELKKIVEENLEKRFIYFLTSRTKVRFDVRYPPRFARWSKKLHVNFVVGKQEQRVKRKIDFPNVPTSIKSKARFQLTDKFLRIWWSPGQSIMFSVHDFIQYCDLTFGIDTHVHYIGITENPHERPLSRKHRGAADMFHNISNEQNDFFIVINLFKVLARSLDHQAPIQFMVANAMTDEIRVGPEGNIIEYSLVAYFDSPFQKEQKSRERAALSRILQNLESEKNIVGVLVDIELDKPSEYFRFCSNVVSAADRHVFLVRLQDGKLNLEQFPTDFDAEKFFLGNLSGVPLS